MAQDMHGHSWRSRVAAHLAPVKEYLPHHGHLHIHHHHHHHHHNPPTQTECVDGDAKKHSWSHLAGRMFARRSYSDSDATTSTERVVLLPGWASRRYRAGPGLSNRTGAPYDIEVFVSGYVVKHKAHNTLSRSQRNILGLAKRIASLPKLPDLHHDDAEDHLPHETEHSAESAEDLLSKTALLDESTEELDVQVLQQSPKEFSADLGPKPRFTVPLDGVPLSISASVPNPRELPRVSHSKAGHDHLHLRRWHSNLETRLHPFWAGVLSNRTVRVSVRPQFDLTDAEVESMSPGELELLEQPLGASVVVTDADGAFKIQFVIHWETLCMHPKGAPMTSIDPNREHDFSVTAELMPPLSPPGSPYTPTGPQSILPPSPIPSVPTAITSERVPLTYSPVRVISDIDDTVKLSGIQCGLRAVFHNVFVKDLEESLIPGMGEWYTEMWRRGVRFHYVSNGPFALLPVINEFFQLAQLPAGSVRLRSYGTRAILSDLLGASQPSDRKRDAVLEVLTSFLPSRFILIGDSGEQDLELYAAVARDHPEQILCIFIRDVNTYEDGGGGIEDPTGFRARECGKKRNAWGMSMSRGGRLSPKSSSQSLPLTLSTTMSRVPSDSTDDYLSKTPTSSTPGGQRPYTDTLYSEPESYCQSQATVTPTMPMMPTLTHRLTLSESERKRSQLQTRLWKACAEVPTNVVIRIFRDPRECVEALQLIDPHLSREKD